jgi:hypothetical protein
VKKVLGKLHGVPSMDSLKHETHFIIHETSGMLVRTMMYLANYCSKHDIKKDLFESFIMETLNYMEKWKEQNHKP